LTSPTTEEDETDEDKPSTANAGAARSRKERNGEKRTTLDSSDDAATEHRPSISSDLAGMPRAPPSDDGAGGAKMFGGDTASAAAVGAEGERKRKRKFSDAGDPDMERTLSLLSESDPSELTAKQR